MRQSKAWIMLSVLMAASLALSNNAVAGVVAIVNKENSTADKDMIGKLYNLEAKSWSDGALAIIYELSNEAEREAFCQAYTGKSASAIKAALSKAVFVGRAQPRKVLNSDAEVKNEVAKDKNAVGYVDESSVDTSIRVVR
jgi:ABC-type phosphate transport system substrate-binding protein